MPRMWLEKDFKIWTDLCIFYCELGISLFLKAGQSKLIRHFRFSTYPNVQRPSACNITFDPGSSGVKQEGEMHCFNFRGEDYEFQGHQTVISNLKQVWTYMDIYEKQYCYNFGLQLHFFFSTGFKNQIYKEIANLCQQYNI